MGYEDNPNRKPVCHFCGDEAEADDYCEECEVHICEECDYIEAQAKLAGHRLVEHRSNDE